MGMLSKRMVWVGVAVALLVGLPALYLWAAMSWSYSSGERAGWVQKLSHKGWLCKTWEGELALVSTPGAPVEKFPFTVHGDEVAAEINRLMGNLSSILGLTHADQISPAKEGNEGGSDGGTR